MEEYNCYSIEQMKKFYQRGAEWSTKYRSFREALEYADISFSWDEGVFAVLEKGFNGEPVDFTVKKYIRIGEPRVDGNAYMNSWNYADDRRERGISVISEDWLNSLKSVFFNLDSAKSRGVYEIEGFEISTGGDDEPLIYAMGWAKKLSIRSRSGMIKWLKANNAE